jgi:putative aminopeptidase FrvX
MLELLQTLCRIDGVSGCEDAVCDYIRAWVTPYADSVTEDVMGNLLCYKKGVRHSGRTLMLAAHMDEVGLIVTSITDDGFLRFGTSGGIDEKVLLGTRVRIGDVRGVVGVRATHLNTLEEEKTLPEVRAMYIDIGAASKEDAEKRVQPGDFAAFDNEPTLYGDMLKAKAIDDRVGCAVLMKLLREGPPVDMWFAFTVQEEQGLRGARPAAYRIRPDLAIVVEGTTAGDIPGVKGAMKACVAGRGPVIPMMDSATLYDPVLVQRALEIAERAGIPCQTKTYIAGGTDAGAISRTAGGAKTLGVAAAVRYIHTPASSVAVADLEPMYTLVRTLCENAERL